MHSNRGKEGGPVPLFISIDFFVCINYIFIELSPPEGPPFNILTK